MPLNYAEDKINRKLEQETSLDYNNKRQRRFKQRFSGFIKSRIQFLLLSIVFVAFSTVPLAEAALLQGCNFGEELCDAGEICVPDGLFGQCYSDAESEILRPLVLEKPLNTVQSELLRLELTRLANLGLDWPHARSQCVFAYFKLSILYKLDYDTEFCSVRNPNNIWSLVQRVQNILFAEKEANSEALQNALENSENLELNMESPESDEVQLDVEPSSADVPAIVVPVVIVNEEEPEGAADVPYPLYDLVEEARPDLTRAAMAEPVSDSVNNDISSSIQQNETSAEKPNEQETTSSEQETEQVLNNIYQKLRAGRLTSSDSEQQINQGFLLQQIVHFLLEKRSTNEESKTVLSNDEEKQLNDYIQDILNNRNPKVKALKTNQLNKLVAFMGSLQNALQYDPLNSDPEIEEEIPLTSETNGQQLFMKKDIEKFNNADMGLANTEHKIVKGGVQRVEGNRVYLKIAHQNLTENELYKLIAYLDEKIAEPNHLYFDEFLYEDGQLSFRISRVEFIPELTQQLQKQKKNIKTTDKELDNASGVAQAVYKRRKDIQSLAGVEVDETGIGSGIDVVPVESIERDWLFAPILAVCALTIVSLLSVLAVHVLRIRRKSSTKKDQNLPSVIDHFEGKVCTVYEDLCRQRMNNQDVPMAVGALSKHSSTSSWPDENVLQSSNLDISTGHSFLKDCLAKPNEITNQWRSLEKYVNANAETQMASNDENIHKNYDSNVLPYDESNVTILSKDSETTAPENYINASRIHDDDPRQVAYIATQAPLQNTVTDFWTMIWEQGIALIVNLCDQEDQKTQKYMKYWPEEVNKSYRGNASPVLVHCTNGAGRTGTYCLIDITTNRILKGVKELNIAGSLEYLRDQRMGMVENEQQYKLVFNCVAEEVTSLLKNLQH